MLYYKEINIQNYETIVEKSLDFVKQDNAIFTRENPKASLYWFNFEKYKSAVPEIESAFNEYDLSCTGACVYVMYDPSHTSLHADQTPHIARINLPLLNCDNTFTHFYSGCELHRWVNPHTGNVSYMAKDISRAILEATVEMKKATVVRISEPHKVDLPKDNPMPRITLSLRFNRDPVFLLD